MLNFTSPDYLGRQSRPAAEHPVIRETNPRHKQKIEPLGDELV